MGSVTIDLDGDTERALHVEADLLGFDDVETYLAWIVRRRYAIDHGSERDQLLREYAERMRDLNLDNVQTPPGVLAEDADAEADDATAGDAEEGEAAAEEGSDEVHLVEPPRPDRMRIDRVKDDDLADVAASLTDVEGDRLDAFVRQAVSKTRDRLGGEAGTGIDYDAREQRGGVRPGGEITDLDAIEVPGWDEELIERRRTAVGAALALLKSEGEARRSDFVEELYAEFPAGYDSSSAWWDCIKQGLRQVDRVKPAREGCRTWGFRSTPGRVRRISYEA
ncbi:hypothetical protein HARCEL1_11475 [Halococcoides cellulosivorans]|uniref:Uncharacterized protein n=2 Tax=Halococcoides cellulosivorans TaxID=1679096 RepID=A0A2R4X3A4_9EURY|nr:hypothetical protein HARCEL1_11475 [Halococcoides cellulosivorans]